MFGFFYMSVDNFYYIICFRNEFCYIMANDFTLIVFIKNFFFHYAFAYCCHLWAMFRIDNCCNNITSECRANLI